MMMKKRAKILALNPLDFPVAKRTDVSLPISQDALGYDCLLPFIVVRGAQDGPTLGISAAVHGNELNGISIIHRLLEGLDPKQMRGNIVCAPVVNAPAYFYNQRRFPEDDIDLNHVFPGKKSGKPAEQYAAAFLAAFLPHCDYLVDIHTASEGRINTFYARADLHSPQARILAELIEPKILLHGRSGDGTLRNAARRRGIPAITLEAGNPSEFQGKMILEGESGLQNILFHYGMSQGPNSCSTEELSPAVVCKSSKWLRTTRGGLMRLHFRLGSIVEKGQLLTTVVDIFGNELEHCKAQYSGIVIGMARSPQCVPGTRYCHLGAIGEPPRPAEKPSA